MSEIKLPTLPTPSPLREHRSDYSAGEMQAYAIAAIKPYAKRIAELEAALQSQDREDAERYRTLVATGHFVPAPRPYFSVWGLRTTEGKATKAELDEAIDHARRIEGDRK